MKPATIQLILVLTLLSGCATPPPGELILTEEDMRLKRQPASCLCKEKHVEIVSYSK